MSWKCVELMTNDDRERDDDERKKDKKIQNKTHALA